MAVDAASALIGGEAGMVAAELGQAGAQLECPCGRRVETVPVGPAPDERQHSARREHPVELRRRGLGIEPVERVADGDGGDGTVSERDSLGAALEHALGADAVGKARAHLGSGLDRRDLVPCGRQRFAEQAGAGREVEHRRAGRQAERGHDLRRVGSTPGVVRRGRGLAEAARVAVRPDHGLARDRAEDDDRDLPVGALLVDGVVAVGGDGQRPEALALVSLGLAGDHLVVLAAHLHSGTWVRLEVGHHAGMASEPPREATITMSSPSRVYMSGAVRFWPLLRPTWSRSRTGAPLILPPIRPPLFLYAAVFTLASAFANFARREPGGGKAGGDGMAVKANGVTSSDICLPCRWSLRRANDFGGMT